MTPAFLTTAQVATLIGFATADAFLRHRPRLETDTLFPPPLPTSRRPLRWRHDAVQAWLDRQGLPTPPATAPEATAAPPQPRFAPRLIDLARTA